MDIRIIRDDPDLVKDNQKRRFLDPSLVDKILDLDIRWKSFRYRSDNLRSFKNILSTCFKDAPTEVTISWTDHFYTLEQLIDDLMNKIKDVKLLVREQLKLIANYITNLIEIAEKNAEDIDVERSKLVFELGNMLHKDVMIDNDEDRNPIVYEFKSDTNKNFPDKPLDHIDLLEKLGFIDTENGINIAGNRGYFITGMGVKLNLAIINYALDFLHKKEYKLMETPHFVNGDMMKNIAQLSEYRETLYKLEGYDKYLIATSEQPLTAYFENKILSKKELPVKMAGLSSCYRKEAGASSRHTRGIYRVHQFQKVEQFCVTEPDKSWDMFNDMINTSKEFYSQLGLTFRVVQIVSGALNNAASMKYDLEAYYPGSNEYCELVSCTNVLDYFSKRIKTKNGKGEYLHMLNCTLTANTRTICALVETYQTEKGFIVPDVLQFYMGGVTFIPFLDN